MNREIKYRAWHKGYKEFYEVSCIDWEAQFVWVKYYDDDREEWFSREEHFADVELLQYTGLEDKNGNDIYEGDYLSIIVFEDNQEYKGSVVFSEGGFCLEVTMLDNKYKIPFVTFGKDVVSEVLGSTYEKPLEK